MRAANCLSAHLFFSYCHLAHKYRAVRNKLFPSIVLTSFLFFCALPNSPSLSAQSEPGISSPAAGASVSGAVPIIGTAVIEPFQRYEIYIKQEPNGDDAYIYLSGGTEQIVNGQLGVLDANAFAPGIYSIRLRVVKLDGNYAEYFAPNISINQGPSPTPTSSEPTPTPIPTATFTPAPQPTPAVGEVTQPQIEVETAADNTPTAEPVAAADSGNSSSSAEGAEGITLPSVGGSQSETSTGGLSSQLGDTFTIDRLRDQFFLGMRYSAIIFALVGILFLSKSLIRWLRTQL